MATRVIEPFSAFGTQAEPNPIATATGPVPTTTLRTMRPDSGFVPSRRFRSVSTVQTRPAPRTTGGCGGASCPGRFCSVSSIFGPRTSSELGSTGRGFPPVTNFRSSATAMPPRMNTSSARSNSRPRVNHVGCRA